MAREEECSASCPLRETYAPQLEEVGVTSCASPRLALYCRVANKAARAQKPTTYVESNHVAKGDDESAIFDHLRPALSDLKRVR